MSGLDLCIILHNHQPVGNFDHVFEAGCRDCYEPLLETFESACTFPVSLHTSGPLLEWIEERRPELFDRMRRLAAEGRLEMLGGGMYEPIFTMLTGKDLSGQLRMMAAYVESRFGQRPRGIWLPERVWEQYLVSELADAGVEYLAVDDHHFLNAGVSADDLFGYFLAEDRGRTLKVFPGSERLRYLIPFGTVDDCIDYLHEVAELPGDSLVVYADDGEKFGMWPETHKHVYTEGWLRRFLEAVEANRDWINVVTAAEAAELPSRGRVYLPDSSYREMTEWALPAKALAEYEAAAAGLKGDERFETVRRFVRGGTWRGFKAKYREAARMYSRMMLASERVGAMGGRGRPSRAKQAATRALYRGECNCAYWHGVFGGLYLPHLRSAVYRNLIEADDIAAKSATKGAGYATAGVRDFDFDGRDEVLLENRDVFAFVAPSRGGHLYELDYRPKRLNLLDTFGRRYEAYHEKVLRLADRAGGEGDVETIHEIVRAKQEGLEEHLACDSYERVSLVDHLLLAGGPPSAAELLGGRSGVEEWLSGAYGFRTSVRGAGVVMTREGAVPGGGRVAIEKELSLPKSGPRLEATYRLAAATGAVETEPVEFVLGIEFNFAMLAGEAPDRYYATSASANAGNLSTVASFDGVDSVAVVDEWERLRVTLSVGEAATVAVYPVRTVSQSEGGFELVYQSSAVTPLFGVRLEAGAERVIRMILRVEDI